LEHTWQAMIQNSSIRKERNRCIVITTRITPESTDVPPYITRAMYLQQIYLRAHLNNPSRDRSMASSRLAPLLLLLLALLLAAQCSASDDYPGTLRDRSNSRYTYTRHVIFSLYTYQSSEIWSIVMWFRCDVSVEPMLDPKCQVFTQMCTQDSCTDFCLNIGLGAYQGFCTFHDMQFYCCCPIPANTPPPRHWSLIDTLRLLLSLAIISVIIDLCERALAHSFSCQ
jgi:hypothetical protein